MLELKILPDVCIFHHSRLALSDYAMTEIAVARYFTSVCSYKCIIMTPETSIRFKMSDMFGIMIISHFHFWESILFKSCLYRRYRVINEVFISCVIFSMVCLVKTCDALFYLHQCSIPVSKGLLQYSHGCFFKERNVFGNRSSQHSFVKVDSRGVIVM